MRNRLAAQPVLAQQGLARRALADGVNIAAPLELEAALLPEVPAHGLADVGAVAREDVGGQPDNLRVVARLRRGHRGELDHVPQTVHLDQLRQLVDGDLFEARLRLRLGLGLHLLEGAVVRVDVEAPRLELVEALGAGAVVHRAVRDVDASGDQVLEERGDPLALRVALGQAAVQLGADHGERLAELLGEEAEQRTATHRGLALFVAVHAAHRLALRQVVRTVRVAAVSRLVADQQGGAHAVAARVGADGLQHQVVVEFGVVEVGVHDAAALGLLAARASRVDLRQELAHLGAAVAVVLADRHAVVQLQRHANPSGVYGKTVKCTSSGA